MLHVWTLRLLLAALLMSGLELLLWPVAPLERPVQDWLLLLPAYVALATLLLDLCVRYRARDLYDVMTIAGVVGLVASLIANPDSSLVEFPLTILTRVMGANVALVLGMFGVWIVLTAAQFARYRWLLLGYAVFGGFYWGTWLRWTPELTGRLAQVSPDEMAVAGGMFLAVVLFAFAMLHMLSRNQGAAITTDALRLSPAALVLLLVVLLALFVLRAVEGVIGGDFLALIAGLIALGLTVLWFRRPTKPRQLLDAHVPPHPLPVLWLLPPLVAFIAATALAYSLPRLDLPGASQLTFMIWGFAGFGMLWPMIVTLIVGLRGLYRQLAWQGD